LQDTGLAFLAPLGGIAAAVSVDPSRANLRDQEGLARAAGLILHPFIQIVQVFRRGCVVVPEGIDIVGHHIRQVKTDIGLKLAAGKGTGAGDIQRTQQIKLLSVTFSAVFALAGAFV